MMSFVHLLVNTQQQQAVRRIYCCCCVLVLVQQQYYMLLLAVYDVSYGGTVVSDRRFNKTHDDDTVDIIYVYRCT